MAAVNPHRIGLKVNGRIYEGWTGARIQRGVEQLVGTFSVQHTDRWTGQAERSPIVAGNACVLTIDDQVVISGWVDDDEDGLDAKEHGISVSGRDAACDLVDCAAVHQAGEWHGVTLMDIVAELVKPFGIPVRSEVATGKAFEVFAIDKGETVIQAIRRLCDHRGVLAVSDGLGGIVITRSGTKRCGGALIEGENVKRRRRRRSHAQRFSEYRVLGQDGAGEDDAMAAAPTAVARDPGVTRYRPTIIKATDEGDGVSFAERAAFAARVARARAHTIEVTVQGWTMANGLVWPINQLVPVRLPSIGVDTDMLIAGVEFTIDENDGSLAVLQLVGSGAYEVLPIPEEAA
ncbi:MAG: phage baseplate assembly protein [Pseudomonadota bacterium]